MIVFILMLPIFTLKSNATDWCSHIFSQMTDACALVTWLSGTMKCHYYGSVRFECCK